MRSFACLLLLLAVSLGVTADSNPQGADSGDVRVVLETDQGPVVMQLFNSKAPKTTQQFLNHVDSGFYDGTIFHRVIPGFIIQGGGFTPELVEKAVSVSIPNESRNRLPNRKWSVAMARLNDPDSAGSQFFINLANNSELNFSYSKPGYTVFADIIAGQDILEAATKTPRATRGHLDDVPETPLLIIKAYRQEPGL
ncbi:MAG TPA: peptidylprolyl isomerase [Pseudomonadales bacterium]